MIFIHKNDSTVFADQDKFLTFHIKTNKNLNGWKAEFCLCSVKKVIEDISTKTFEVILSAKDTSKLYYGKPFGELRLIDNKGNIKTIANNIPFCVTKDIVENESQIIDLDIPESSEIEISVSYKAPSGGTTDYEELENIPSINGVELIGEKSLEELGIQPQGNYLKEHQDISHLASKKELEDGLETKQPKGDYALKSDIPNVDLTNLATKDELTDKANDDDVVHINGTEVINGAKTFNSAVNFIGSGDSNSVGISENTRFNIHNTNKTILGMGNGLFYINHGDYRLRLRGKDVRPHYNTDSNYLALLSDIPNTSNLATKTEVMQMIASIPQFSLKVVAELPTTGEKMTLYLVPKEGSGNDVYNEFVWIEEVNSFEFIGTTAVDLTDYALKSEIIKDFKVPLAFSKLETSITNVSTDSNGVNFLNLNAYNATLEDYLPSFPEGMPNPLYDKTLNFRDRRYEQRDCFLGFSKVTGVNGQYPILNLEGYNAIIRNFEVGDIVVGDKRSEETTASKHFQMVFGKLSNDGTFIPKIVAKTFEYTYGGLAYINMLKNPNNAYKYSRQQSSSTHWEMEYYSTDNVTYISTLDGSFTKTFCGVKFVGRNGAVGLNWVNEDGSEYELTDTPTFDLDNLGINCVIYSNWVMPTSDVTDSEVYGFDKTKYFVAKDTIDNVVVRITDGTGFNGLSLNYNNEDFVVVENKLTLKTKLQSITQSDYDTLATKDPNTLYLIEE